jgi:hypothetical protein
MAHTLAFDIVDFRVTTAGAIGEKRNPLRCASGAASLRQGRSGSAASPAKVLALWRSGGLALCYAAFHVPDLWFAVQNRDASGKKRMTVHEFQKEVLRCAESSP